MKKTTERSRADGVAIVALEGKLLIAHGQKPVWGLNATTLLVCDKTGATHGHLVAGSWSPRTLELLGQLAEAMEEDQLRNHFGEPERAPTVADHLRGMAG